MEVIELKKFVNNFRLATINPAKKVMTSFLNERITQIKQIQSNRNVSDAHMKKSLKEQKFINSIIDLDSEYMMFMESVENILSISLNQYADYIHNAAKLREQNQFLKERLETMDNRELIYLELLKNKR